MKNKIKNKIDKIKNYFKTFTFKKFLKVLLLVVEMVLLLVVEFAILIIIDYCLNKLIGNWCYLIWGLLLLGVVLVLFQNKKLLRYVKGNGVK